MAIRVRQLEFHPGFGRAKRLGARVQLPNGYDVFVGYQTNELGTKQYDVACLDANRIRERGEGEPPEDVYGVSEQDADAFLAAMEALPPLSGS